MITKELYATTMERLAELAQASENLHKAAQELSPDSFFYPTLPYEDLIVDFIEAAMQDEDRWTSYFAWECNFDLSKECVYDDDGNIIPTGSWEQIYDLIRGGEQPRND